MTTNFEALFSGSIPQNHYLFFNLITSKRECVKCFKKQYLKEDSKD